MTVRPTGRPGRLTDEETADVLRLWRDGVRSAEIGEQVRCSRSTVNRTARRLISPEERRRREKEVRANRLAKLINHLGVTDSTAEQIVELWRLGDMSTSIDTDLYLPPGTTGRVLHLIKTHGDLPQRAPQARSRRRRIVIAMARQGRSNKDIANAIDSTVEYVKSEVKELKKLGHYIPARNRGQAEFEANRRANLSLWVDQQRDETEIAELLGLHIPTRRAVTIADRAAKIKELEREKYGTDSYQLRQRQTVVELWRSGLQADTIAADLRLSKRSVDRILEQDISFIERSVRPRPTANQLTPTSHRPTSGSGTAIGSSVAPLDKRPCHPYNHLSAGERQPGWQGREAPQKKFFGDDGRVLGASVD